MDSRSTETRTKIRRHGRRFFPAMTLALAVLLSLPLTACGGNGEGNETQPADTALTQPLTDTAEPTAAETADVTDPPVTEPLTEPETDPAGTNPPALYEPGDAAPVCAPRLPGSMSRTYAETPTHVDNIVRLDKADVTISYQSTFYGHDSAIDRDFVQYGWRMSNTALRHFADPAQYFMADFTGDLYADMVSYEDGVLTLRPTIVDTRETYTYNGQVIPSVYAGDNAEYSQAEPLCFRLGLDAVLRGAGDFNKDGFNDVLLVGADGRILIGCGSEDGFDVTAYGLYHGGADKLFAGDVDGDGYCDLLFIDGHEVTVLYFDGAAFTPAAPVVTEFADRAVSLTAVGDVNHDRRADVVFYESDPAVMRTLFGRGDGFFGPHADELGNKNLYAEGQGRVTKLTWMATGDLTGDGVPDVLLSGRLSSKIGVFLSKTEDEPAYDYSIFGMETKDGKYRLFSGGRWYDQSDDLAKVGDGDHVMLYFSDDGVTWDRYIDGPAIRIGWELGLSDWWTDNTLEPEVVYVDGVYHMFLQSSGATESGYYGDYINYARSTDGIHFDRKIDSPVVLPAPGKTFRQFKEVYGHEYGFNHEEVIYVPDDPDGKCFWLYTGHFLDNRFAGYVRIRSADPTVFYWSEREAVSGFSEIGNQIAYVNDYDGKGGRLFLRITFTMYEDANGSRSVPTMQYSTDGLHFSGSKIRLASVNVSDPITENNHNVYFLGLCTLDGTGEIVRQADGSFRLVYLATTANQSAGMPIYAAEGGAGVMTFTLR